MIAHGAEHHPDRWLTRHRKWVEKKYYSPPTDTWHATYASLSQELNRAGIDQEKFFVEYGKDCLPDIYAGNVDPVLGNARNESHCLNCSKDVKFDRLRRQYPAFCGFSCSTTWYAENTNRVETAITTRTDRRKSDSTFHLNQTNVGYWTRQGFTEDEAKQKVSESQRTFTLAKLIRQHGEEEGRRRWEDRQERWLNSFMQSCDVNDSHTISKVSRELFDRLRNDFPTILYGKDEYRIKAEGRTYRVDCFHPETGRIIEFFGDYYHGNPIKYGPEAQLRNRIAREQWDFDAERLDRIRTNKNIGGILVVWENDWKTDSEGVYQKCWSFLHDA